MKLSDKCKCCIYWRTPERLGADTGGCQKLNVPTHFDFTCENFEELLIETMGGARPISDYLG